MSSPQPQARRWSRRAIVAVGGSAGAAALLAACGGQEDQGLNASHGVGSRDVHVLNRAIDMEHRLAAVYMASAAVVRSAGARATVTQLEEQEREHVRGLGEAVKDLGGTPTVALTQSEYRARMRLDDLTDAAVVWHVGTRLENEAIIAYLGALPLLSTGELRQTISAIIANESQHLSMISGRRRPDRPSQQAPTAFVNGRPA